MSSVKIRDNTKYIRCNYLLRRSSTKYVKVINSKKEIDVILQKYDITAEVGDKLCSKCSKNVCFGITGKRKKPSVDLISTPSTSTDLTGSSTLYNPMASKILMSSNKASTSAQPSYNQISTSEQPNTLMTSTSSAPVEKNIASNSQSFSESDYVLSTESSGSLYIPNIQSPKEKVCITLPIQTTTASQHYCIICNSIENRSIIPFAVRLHCYRKKKIYIPQSSRACTKHIINSRFYEEDMDKIKIFSNTANIPIDEVPKFFEGLVDEGNKSILNQAGDYQINEDRLKTLTGLSADNLKYLTDVLTLRNSKNRSSTEALITFLFKMRSGSSNKNIATVFNLPREQLVSDICDSILQSFEKDILPTCFGAKNLIRKDLIEHHTSTVARKLLQLDKNQLVLIFDGTYIKHQKSSNNQYQRRAYSGQKKNPLCKPFTICTTDGYVVDCCGPFEAIKNDAKILREVLNDPNGIITLMKPGDICIVDREFRDAVSMLEEKKFKVLMPALKGKRKQLPTEESNSSRIVTKLRWVVEAVHGQISQKFKLLHNQFDNKMLPKVSTYSKIANFLNNAFGKRFNSDDSMCDEIVNNMLNTKEKKNTLADQVEKENWNKKTKPFEKLTSNNLDDFPELREKELKILFSGTYQFSQAVSYLAEMINDDNEIDLEYVKTDKNIIKVRIRSRHIRSKSYTCYIDYKPYTDGCAGIQRYTCECPNGLRTIGCCSHVAAVIYFLSNARYQSNILKPAVKLTEIFKQDEIYPYTDQLMSDDEEDEN